ACTTLMNNLENETKRAKLLAWCCEAWQLALQFGNLSRSQDPQVLYSRKYFLINVERSESKWHTRLYALADARKRSLKETWWSLTARQQKSAAQLNCQP